MLTQPNPSLRRPDDLNRRDREHYEVARTFTGEFTRTAFRQRYATMYPDRNEGSIIPSDYCFNLDNRGNPRYPRFLLYEERNRYRFVGMDGHGDGAAPERPTATTPGPASPRDVPARVPLDRASNVGPGRGFHPSVDRMLLRDDVARRAIAAYNAEPIVQGQEHRAFVVLGAGFERGRIAAQLRGLDAAYSTRSVGTDLDAIAAAIEADFDAWTRLLGRAVPLTEGVTDPDVLRHLFGFFLEADTRRRPRSLATKALHFAAPQCFIPADEYAVDLLGRLLGAGRWSDTAGLDVAGMARWYHGYLSAVYRLGVDNIDLVGDLLALDADTAPGGYHSRVRGWPKILDKILWWCGRPGATVSGLFRR